MSDRNPTYYFPSSWCFREVQLWLKSPENGIDYWRVRVEFDGQYSAELRGSEQHERTTNPMG